MKGAGFLLAVSLSILLLGVVPSLPRSDAGSAATPQGPPSPDSGPALAVQRATGVIEPSNPARVSPNPTSATQGEIIVNSTDPKVVPSDGLQVNLTGFPPAVLAPNTSVLISAEEELGGFDAVFGIYENTQTTPTAVFTVFNNSTNAQLFLEYWRGLPILPGAGYDFTFIRSTGTIWQVSVNGVLFGNSAQNASFDFRTTQETWGRGIFFSIVVFFSQASPIPPSLTIPLCLAVHTGGQWYLPTIARPHFIGSPAAEWGIEGRAQNSSLAPGEVLTGTLIPLTYLQTSAALWTGGPIGITVGIRASPSLSVGLDFVTATISTNTVNGTVLGGVYVYVTDALGGAISPPTLDTNSSGLGVGTLSTANVSMTEGDTLNATSTLFGYRGSGTTTLTITPAAHVLLSPQPSAVNLPTVSSVRVTVTARAPSGVTMPNDQLSYTVAGVATLDAIGGTTNQTGVVSFTCTALQVAGTAIISIHSTSPGTWGFTQIEVTVTLAPASLLPPYFVPALIVASAWVLAVAIFVLVRSRRPPRRPLPSMSLPPVRPTPPPGAASNRTEGQP